MLTEQDMAKIFERVRNEPASEFVPMAVAPELARRAKRYVWSHAQWELAKRLGLVRVARTIHDRCGPWIIPTASAEYALRAAGMWPVDDLPEPTVSATDSPYR